MAGPIPPDGIHPTSLPLSLSTSSPPVMDHAANPTPHPTLPPPDQSAIIQGDVRFFHTYPTVSRTKDGVSCVGFKSEVLCDGVGRPRNRASESRGLVCRCLAGASADCAAIFCCPFSCLHLVGLICLGLPACLFHKAKSRKICSSSPGGGPREEPIQPTLSPCISHGEDLDGKEGSQSLKYLQDEEFLRNHFDCKNLGFGSFDLTNSI